jgi:hypothetical protein
MKIEVATGVVVAVVSAALLMAALAAKALDEDLAYAVDVGLLSAGVMIFGAIVGAVAMIAVAWLRDRPRR